MKGLLGVQDNKVKGLLGVRDNKVKGLLGVYYDKEKYKILTLYLTKSGKIGITK